MNEKPVVNADLKMYDKKFIVEDNTLWEVWGNKISKSEVIWDMENICDLLNSLTDENEQLRNDLDDSYDANATLEAEILKLRQQIQEMQQDEKLYANEIVKLNKEVKDNQFLRLGNDY